MNVCLFNRCIVAVNVIVHRDDGKILGLIHSTRGKLELPGGKIEPGETVELAALREVYEETGLNVMIGHGEAFLGLGEWHHSRDIIATVIAKPFPSSAYDELHPTKEGHPMWVDPEEFRNGNFWDYNERAFQFFHIHAHEGWGV